MKTVNTSSSRNSRFQSRCNGSVLAVTLLILSAVGSFVTLQTLRLYQEQQSANQGIRKELVKKQALIVADEILRRFNGRKVTFFAAETKKPLHSYIIDTQLWDLGTDDFEQFFCPNSSDNIPNARISVKFLPKLSENFIDKRDFTLETLHKRLRETVLTSKIPFLNSPQKEILFERWRFLQTSKRNEPLKIPLFMPIFTFMGQKFDHKETECALWNPYDRPLKGKLQFKCVAEILDEQGNLFVDPNIEFGLEVSFPPGNEATFSFNKFIPNLDRLLHVEIKNCPKTYERCEWDIPMAYTCDLPLDAGNKSLQCPMSKSAPHPYPSEQSPNGIIFNTQTRAQQLDVSLLFNCDKIYHSVGQRDRMFFADKGDITQIPWNIFSQNPPSNSIPFYFFGTEEELLSMYPPCADKEEFWKFFAYDPENSEKQTVVQNLTNDTQSLSVLQANIDTWLIFVCLETYSDLCVSETEIKHTSNGVCKAQAARYYYKRKPKNSRKPILPPKSPTKEPIILQSSDEHLKEAKISPVIVVHPNENPKKEEKIPPTPQPTTVILETPQPSVPEGIIEKSFEKIDTPPVNQPSRKRRKNSAPASVTFTRLNEEGKNTKQETKRQESKKRQKQYPPDEPPNELSFSNHSCKIDASCDTNDASSDHRTASRRNYVNLESDSDAEPSKYSKPSFDFKALRDDESRSRKGTAVSDTDAVLE